MSKVFTYFSTASSCCVASITKLSIQQENINLKQALNEIREYVKGAYEIDNVLVCF